MKKVIIVFILGISSLFLSVSALAASEMEEFKRVYAQYNKKIEAGDTKGSLPFAAESFKLGSLIFEPESANLLALADNYAYVLLALGEPVKANAVYEELIASHEEFYGLFSQTLVPVLNGAAKITAKPDPEKSKAYALRALKLNMRHNSLEMSQKIDEGVLVSAKEINKIKKRAEKSSGKEFKIFEGPHWSIAYESGYEEGVSLFNDQLELAYRSIRSFMLALQFSQRPLNGEKLPALLFANEEGYLTYIEKEGLSTRSKGSFYEDIETLIMYDRIHKRSDWEIYKRTNVVAPEAMQQVAVASGLLSTRKTRYPLWFWDGIANTFEFNKIDEEFGPHTDNLSSRNWEIAQELIDDDEWLTLREFIGLSIADDREKKNKRVLYYMGTFFVRFLYTHHTDELLEYISFLNKSSHKKQTSKDRLKTFFKVFGNPDNLEKSWRRFIEGYGITFSTF